MADAIIFGVEQELCTDPTKAGCRHTVGVHGSAANGCSYIGVSGWCDCRFVPERVGVALLLEQSVSASYTDGKLDTVPQAETARQDR